MDDLVTMFDRLLDVHELMVALAVTVIEMRSFVASIRNVIDVVIETVSFDRSVSMGGPKGAEIGVREAS